MQARSMAVKPCYAGMYSCESCFFYGKDGAGVDAIIAQQAKKIVEGLGGAENILAVETCFTRLRVEVKDATFIRIQLLQESPCFGVIQRGTEIQLVYGVYAAKMESQVRAILGHSDGKE